MIIELNEEQEKKFITWQKNFIELPYIGSIGGHFGLEIIFTSIGKVISGTAWNGEKIDLTDYNEF